MLEFGTIPAAEGRYQLITEPKAGVVRLRDGPAKRNRCDCTTKVAKQFCGSAQRLQSPCAGDPRTGSS